MRNLAIRYGLTLLTILTTQSSTKAACPNVTPAFTYSQNKSCGTPVLVTFSNTSTGTNSTVARYTWKANGQVFRTTVGKTGAVSYTITAPGTYTIRLLVQDTGTGGCVDSTSSTITVSAQGPRVRDGLGNFTYAPVWENCIGTSGSPDTFGLNFRVQDTLKSYTIRWGDGTSSTGTRLLSTQTLYHKYNTLGQFTVLIISNPGTCTDTLQGLVVNERQPVAGLIGPPTGMNQGCVPMRVRFINNSLNSSPSTTFTWNMGDGVTYRLGSNTYRDTLFHIYRRATCNGVVTLTASNACGSSATTWNPIQASGRDSAIASVANPNNCNLSTAFLFNNNSLNRYCGSPNPKRYLWNWGDGTNSGWISSTAQQSKTYSRRGTYTITLIDSNGCGKDTFDMTLTIDSLPTVNAYANPLMGCAPLAVQFVDTSIGNVLTRNWKFNDPYVTSTQDTSSLRRVSHTYNNGGVYAPVLTVSNRCGSVRDTVRIRVQKAPDALFSSITGGCTPYTANFTNQTDTLHTGGSVSYAWDFGDGTTSSLASPASKVYNTPGNYTVRLIATSPCGSDTFSRTFTVTNKPTLNLSVLSSPLCNRSQISFRHTVGSSGSTITWYYGDGGSASFNGNTVYTHNHRYDSARTYTNTVYLSDPSGCRDTQTLSVSLDPAPVADYTTSGSNGCGPLMVTFTNTSTHQGTGTFSQLTHQWTYGNGARSTRVDSAVRYHASLTRDSIYSVKLVVRNSYGCFDSVTRQVRVYPKPDARFTPSVSAGCGPLNVNFTNQSVPFDTGSIRIMSFRWDLGNGTQATRRDTAARYRASATRDTLYNVRLIAFSEHGCIDTLDRSIRVYPQPLSNFTPSSFSGCNPLAVNFYNNSIPHDTGSIGIMSFEWNLGNGVMSSQREPSTTYVNSTSRDSQFNIRLIAFSEHGCRDTSSASVIVRPAPAVDFSMDRNQGCSPLTVQFTNLTVNGGDYNWDFGGAGDTNRNASHTFYGQYLFDTFISVRLRVVSPFGCVSSSPVRQVRVLGRPRADYSTTGDTFCYPDRVQFFNESQGAVSYRWTFGDNASSTQVNPSHFFPKHPNAYRDTQYQIAMVAYNASNCSDTTRGIIKVLPYPLPSFTVDRRVGCGPMTVRFTNQSNNSRRYQWNFGDGTTSTLTNPVHTFVNTGVRDTAYHVVLYSYSTDCVDTIGLWIRVNHAPYAFFRTDRVNPCDAGWVQFQNLSENFNSWGYDFRDGTTSSQNNPLHQFYTSPYRDTTYRVMLVVNTTSGCSDTFERNVTLPQRLQIRLKDTSYRVCAPATIRFVNQSAGATRYFWDFGDYVGSTSANPIHTYTRPGVYTVKLSGFDYNGCIDSTTKPSYVTVLESPQAGFDFNPTDARMPTNNTVQFTDRSVSSVPLSYDWDFDDPNGTPDRSSLRNPAHVYSDSGNYDVRMIANNGSCADTAFQRVRVEPPYPIANFVQDRDTGCPALTIRFTNTSQYADEFTWYFGDGTRSNEVSPVHIYRVPGTYDVTLFVKGPGGDDFVERRYAVTVLPKPYAGFYTTPSVVYLPRAIFSTRNESEGAETYSWVVTNRNGEVVGTSSKRDEAFNLQDTGYHHVQLVVTASSGCTDTAYKENAVLVNTNGLVWVPNAFTPNQNGLNDLYKPDTRGVMENHYEFAIYNRWGQRLFETNDIYAGWDGTVKGTPCQEGVYVYRLKARLTNGDDIAQEGPVHLLR